MALKFMHLCPLIVGLLFLSGVNCSEVESDGLEGVSSYHVVFGVFLLACFIGLLALCGGRVDVARPAPSWILQLDMDPEVDKGITGCSDGFTINNPTSVTRHRTGNFETDGAKFGAALSKGKHVFEIHWPKKERGLFATVGVGSDNAELFCKPRDSLVGKDRFSFGLDIARRKLVTKGQATQGMPAGGFVPEKFYMYVDCDSGTVGFGSDVEYWGAPLNIPREHFPVYPMIGCCCPDATIKMIYRGSENKDKPPMNFDEVKVVDADGNPVAGASNVLPPPGAGYAPKEKKDKKDKKDKDGGVKDDMKKAMKVGKKGFKMFDKFVNN